MEENQKPTLLGRLKVFYGECKRVLTVTKKPDMFEYKTIVKVSGIGIALIGLIGFVVTMARQLLFK